MRGGVDLSAAAVQAHKQQAEMEAGLVDFVQALEATQPAMLALLTAIARTEIQCVPSTIVHFRRASMTPHVVDDQVQVRIRPLMQAELYTLDLTLDGALEFAAALEVAIATVRDAQVGTPTAHDCVEPSAHVTPPVPASST